MRSRIFLKLMAVFLAVIAVVLLTVEVQVQRAWERSLREHIESSLRQQTLLFSQRADELGDGDPVALAQEYARITGARATVIDKGGLVLADSEADPAHMENHANRPEVAEALTGSLGTSTRHSATVGIDFLYTAAPYRQGVVRLAYPLHAVAATTTEVRHTLLRSFLVALLLALLLAGIASHLVARRLRRVVRFAEAVAAGDFSARIGDSAFDEIAQVTAALDRTAHRLEENFAALEDSRQQLETLLDNVRDGVIAVSAEGRVQWVNVFMRQLLPVRARAGAPLVEWVRDPDLLAALEWAARHRQVQYARATSVAPGRVFQVSAAPLPAGGAVAVLHDLTDLERVEKTRRDFIANVSHELRTPLTSIQGYAETLLDHLPEHDGVNREFLEIIRTNASRMARLTEDLLALARVESGEVKLDLATVPAAQLLAQAQSDFRDHAAGFGLELLITQETPTPVRADRDVMQQVFANLIENACRYAASGKRIELGAHDCERNVEFSVRDFGPGIPSEHLPRLFERFYRVDKARSREAGGTGLGLAIVKHIVLRHGGTVRAESELGRGSSFFFTLPAAGPATTS